MSGAYTSDGKAHETAVETLYRQARQASGMSDDAVQPLPDDQGDTVQFWEHESGILVYPLRTPTLPPATHTNCYVIGAGELVVVDPSSPHADMQAALDRMLDDLIEQGCRVVEIWLTHHHLDHVSGAAHLAGRLGVPVAAHSRTAALVRKRVQVDRLLADGDTRTLAGGTPRRLRAVHTPGHAPGHLCFLEEHGGALVAGDMVAGQGTILVEPEEGSMRQYLDSLRHMKGLAPSALLPAHGPMIADAAAKLDRYIDHRLWREERVMSALGHLGAATTAQLVPVAYADVPPAVYSLAERSLLAHLVKLAEDGRAVSDGETWRPRS